jgi:hypothetical protein
MPSERESLILVVNSSTYNEKDILKVVAETCKNWEVRARNISVGNVNLAIEVKTPNPMALVEKVNAIENITGVSLVEHDGDVTA